ncbi:MAG: cytochrome P460 family protein [Myxococcota bacterium]
MKSMWLGAEHGLADPFAGLHHVYVNPMGADAMRDGKPLPDGTVLVFDLVKQTRRSTRWWKAVASLVG